MGLIDTHRGDFNAMQIGPTIDPAFAFGQFKLIPGQRLLLRNNRRVKLGGRALDVLHLLLARAGEEVSKDDLIKFAWPKVFVDERNLKVHISCLRQALDDTVPQATYIATIVGHGYQFVAPVRTESVLKSVTSGHPPPVEGNLPPLPRLVGRRGDIEGVVRALDFAHLVTLVGPGGVGKTSLAMAVAHSRLDHFPDGVRYVDLSATDNPLLLPNLVATALGVVSGPVDLVSTVVEHVKDRRMLIVLDNCEHLLHATAAIAARLIEAKASSCVLATSREPLGVGSENVQRVEPLTVPPNGDVRSACEALAYPSVELFALRAFEKTECELLDGDARDVARLCKALDGLPLAIEIAAATRDRFSPAELLASVSRHLGEFRNDGAVHSRHRTLAATLDWSYRLLSIQESTLFQLLSVFAASFEWTDVAWMARLVQYTPYQTTLALGGLVAKSLVSAGLDGDELRYRLLESTRRYATERLQQGPLEQQAQRLHAQLQLSVFQKSETEWSWVDNGVWRARYGERIADLRKALDWSFSSVSDASLGVDIAISAIRLWSEQSSLSEQLFQVERALNHCASHTDAPLREATLAVSRAWTMTFARRLHAETDAAWITAVAFSKRSGDIGRHLSAMFGQSHFLVYTGRVKKATSVLDEVMRLATQVGDQASIFDAERLRALIDVYLGKLLPAREKLEHLADDLTHMPRSSLVNYQLQQYTSIHGHLALSNWLTGRPEKALEMVEEVVLKTAGQSIGQSNMLAFVALPLALWSGKADALQRYTAILRVNLDHENIAPWEPVHRFYAAAIRNTQGEVKSLDEMRSAIDELVRDRFLVRVPLYFGVLAECLLAEGRNAEADSAVESGLALQRQTQENWCLPELLRIKARTTAARGDQKLAREILSKARDTALAIGAWTFERRIVRELAKMAPTTEDLQGPLERLGAASAASARLEQPRFS